MHFLAFGRSSFLIAKYAIIPPIIPKKLVKDTTNYFFVFQDTLYLVIFLDYFEVVFVLVLSQFLLFQEGFQPDFFLLRTFLVYQSHYYSQDTHKSSTRYSLGAFGFDNRG